MDCVANILDRPQLKKGDTNEIKHPWKYIYIYLSSNKIYKWTYLIGIYSCSYSCIYFDLYIDIYRNTLVQNRLFISCLSTRQKM